MRQDTWIFTKERGVYYWQRMAETGRMVEQIQEGAPTILACMNSATRAGWNETAKSVWGRGFKSVKR